MIEAQTIYVYISRVFIIDFSRGMEPFWHVKCLASITSYLTRYSVHISYIYYWVGFVGQGSRRLMAEGGDWDLA